MKHTMSKKILAIILVLIAVVLTAKAAFGEVNVTSVTMNGIAVNENGSTPAVKPLQQLNFGIVIANLLQTGPLTVNSVTVNFAPGTLDAVSFPSTATAVEIPINQSTTQTINAQVPLSYRTNNYTANIVVSGLSNNLTAFTDTFNFTLNVQQQPQDIIISGFNGAAQVSCSENTPFTINVTNIGSVNQSLTTGGVNVTLRTGSFETFQVIALSANSQTSISLTVPTTNLSAGSNSLTADAAYFYTHHASQTATLTKNPCLVSFSPTAARIELLAGATQQFNITAANATAPISWYVNSTLPEPGATSNTFSFSRSAPGEYLIRANAGYNAADSHSWTVAVNNLVSAPSFTTNIPADATQAQLTAFNNLTLENSNGKIVFNQPVNLTTISTTIPTLGSALDAVVDINDGAVAVDSTAKPALNKTATITIKKTFTNATILRSLGFNTGTYEVCPATVCTVQSTAPGAFVFGVSGFSTYRVVESQTTVPSISISPSPIEFSSANRGGNANVTVTITNIGTTAPITGLSTSFVGIGSGYNPVLTGTLPSTLAPGASATLTLGITVPSNEQAGSHSIGTLRVQSNEINQTATINLNPRSYLTITRVEINGDTSGDLTPTDNNEVEVTVRNDYTADLEDVTITARLLNVDGDDLEEESDSFDLDTGDSESQTLQFDLSGENLDEDRYTLEIEVVGDGTNGTTQRTLENRTVNVERERHKITIKSATVGSSSLQCSRQTDLRVRIENVGRNDEDNVEIRATNSALGLSLSRPNLQLDRFSGADNEYQTSFNINAENAAPGNYPITVEVERGGSVDDSVTVNLDLQNCGTVSNATTTQTATYNLASLEQQLQQQLQQELQAKKTSVAVASPAPEVKQTFRDTNTYTFFLVGLAVLILIAIVLGLAILARGKK